MRPDPGERDPVATVQVRKDQVTRVLVQAREEPVPAIVDPRARRPARPRTVSRRDPGPSRPPARRRRYPRSVPRVRHPGWALRGIQRSAAAVLSSAGRNASMLSSAAVRSSAVPKVVTVLRKVSLRPSTPVSSSGTATSPESMVSSWPPG